MHPHLSALARVTIEAVRTWASKKSDGADPAAEPGPAAELRAASTPKYLGEQSARVRQLVEWATSHPQLDAAHNQSTRSWLCAGQKVLSLDSGHGVVQVRAGIHHKQRMSAPDESLAPGEPSPLSRWSPPAECREGDSGPHRARRSVLQTR